MPIFEEYGAFNIVDADNDNDDNTKDDAWGDPYV